MKKTGVLSVIYFLIGILYVGLKPQTTFCQELFIKSLIIPVLIIIFIIELRRYRAPILFVMLAGLIFSWAGDISLEFSFIAGLACFLTAHIMYITAFFMTPGENVIFRSHWYLLSPVIIYGAMLIRVLFNDLDEMRLPVILYTIVILTMLAGAINRLKKVNRLSFVLVLAGAILFVISDSAIALNKFGFPFKYSGYVIMLTYIMAQYLITSGFIIQVKANGGKN